MIRLNIKRFSNSDKFSIHVHLLGWAWSGSNDLLNGKCFTLALRNVKSRQIVAFSIKFVVSQIVTLGDCNYDFNQLLTDKIEMNLCTINKKILSSRDSLNRESESNTFVVEVPLRLSLRLPNSIHLVGFWVSTSEKPCNLRWLSVAWLSTSMKRSQKSIETIFSSHMHIRLLNGINLVRLLVTTDYFGPKIAVLLPKSTVIFEKSLWVWWHTWAVCRNFFCCLLESHNEKEKKNRKIMSLICGFAAAFSSSHASLIVKKSSSQPEWPTPIRKGIVLQRDNSIREAD